MQPWFWGTLALLVAIIEVILPGFYLIWIAIGALITEIAVLLVPLDSLESQLAVFAAAATLSCAGGFFAYRVLDKHPVETDANRRDRQMIGTHGIVAVPLRNGTGKVRLGDTVWLAEGPDLGEGAPVVVTGVRGTVVIVAPQGG
jgi:inner membrane protein